MNAIAFARAYGFDYVHTPFSEIAHADRPMKDWVDAWETHFNFGVGEALVENSGYGVVDFARNFGFSRMHDLRNSFSRIAPEFRRKYYSNKINTRVSQPIKVGVHIRRGDVVGSEDNLMWTEVIPLRQTLSIAKSILETNHLSYKLCVFSQGKPDDFVDLEPLGVQLFLNADALCTMRELIEADVLIMAKSTFSYVAALLSEGIKIYEPCHYPPMSDWLIRSLDGEFAINTFERQLHFLLESKLSYFTPSNTE